jgi:hypothetical protein
MEKEDWEILVDTVSGETSSSGPQKNVKRGRKNYGFSRNLIIRPSEKCQERKEKRKP